jgi:hypothetical protein
MLFHSLHDGEGCKGLRDGADFKQGFRCHGNLGFQVGKAIG